MSLKFRHRLIHAIPDCDIELQNELLKVSHDKGVSHLLEICHTTMPLSLELLQCVLAKPSMEYRSPINLKSNCRNIPHSARIAHASTLLDMTIALLESMSTRLFEERTLASQVSFQQETPLQWTSNQKVCMVNVEGRGRRLTL